MVLRQLDIHRHKNEPWPKCIPYIKICLNGTGLNVKCKTINFQKQNKTGENPLGPKAGKEFLSLKTSTIHRKKKMYKIGLQKN